MGSDACIRYPAPDRKWNSQQWRSAVAFCSLLLLAKDRVLAPPFLNSPGLRAISTSHHTLSRPCHLTTAALSSSSIA